MNTQLKESSGFLSVKELREFLDAHEQDWTEMDNLYLGKFEDQKILAFPLNKGYSFSKIVEAYGCGGFFIIPTDQEGKEIKD